MNFLPNTYIAKNTCVPLKFQLEIRESNLPNMGQQGRGQYPAEIVIRQSIEISDLLRLTKDQQRMEFSVCKKQQVVEEPVESKF